jgi:ATP-dependent Clp protease ATP-binding subunit ClpA
MMNPLTAPKAPLPALASSVRRPLWQPPKFSGVGASPLQQTLNVKTKEGLRTLAYGEILETLNKQKIKYDGKTEVPNPMGAKPLPNGYAAALIQHFGLVSLMEVTKILRFFTEKGFLEAPDAEKPMAALKISESAAQALAAWKNQETEEESDSGDTVTLNQSPGPEGVAKASKVTASAGVDMDSRITEQGWNGFIEDMTAQAKAGKYRTIIGQPQLRQRLETELSKHFIHHVLINGEAGLGKSSAIKDLARAMANNEADPLKGKKLWRVDCSSPQLADTQAWDHLLQFAERQSDIVLYFDQLQGLFSPDGTSLTEAGKQLGRFIHNPDVRLILEASLGISKLLLNKNPDWVGHLNTITMEEPKRETTLEVINETLPTLCERHGVTYPNPVVQEVLSASASYLKNAFSPVRELDVLDAAGVTAQMEGRKKVSLEDVAKVISEKTGLPLGSLNESDRDKLLRLEELLHKRVISQDAAIQAVANAVRLRRVRLTDDENGPVGNFIFLGPTGVGKTETVKALAEWWTGDEKNLVRLDMGEYMESHSVSRLVGAPPGYVGYEEGGQLTNAIRRRPFGVVVLDEFEKANKSVYKALLPLLDEGRLTDGQGQTINAENYIFVLTGNVAAEEIQKLLDEARQEKIKDAQADISLPNKIAFVVKNALRAIFAPEQLNRFDDIIVFDELAPEDQKKIVALKLGSFIPKVEKKHRVTITLTDDTQEFIAQKLFDRKSALHDRQGGRKANDVLKTYLKMPLAEFFLRNEVQEGDHLVGEFSLTDSGKEELVFSKKESA